MSTDIRDTQLYKELISEMGKAKESFMDIEMYEFQTPRLVADNGQSYALMLFDAGHPAKEITKMIRKSKNGKK